MASVFNDIPIEQLCTRVTSGATPLRSRSDFYDHGTIDWYKTGELTDWYLGPAEERITQRALEETSVKLFPANTVLMAMYGDGKTITSLGILRSTAATNQACAAMFVNEEICDTRYFFYALKERRQLLLKVAAGGAQRNLSGKLIKEFELPIPSLPIQRRIAGILSAYDELIENSQRRIKILESMARAVYREWFVHFRFPGHESTTRVPSPLGEIPQGWEVKKLGDFAQFKSGFAFKSGTFTADGEHRLVTIKNVQDGVFNPASDSRMSELPAKLPPYCVLNDGDILLSLTGNVGRVCLVYEGPFLLNQRVSKLLPVESFDWAMTYFMFREPDMRVRLEQLSNGVAQQNLSPVLAAKMDFICPPRELRQQFSAFGEPLARRIVQLYNTIESLRRARDLLLPRLLSGQV